MRFIARVISYYKIPHVYLCIYNCMWGLFYVNFMVYVSIGISVHILSYVRAFHEKNDCWDDVHITSNILLHECQSFRYTCVYFLVA